MSQNIMNMIAHRGQTTHLSEIFECPINYLVKTTSLHEGGFNARKISQLSRVTFSHVNRSYKIVSPSRVWGTLKTFDGKDCPVSLSLK